MAKKSSKSEGGWLFKEDPDCYSFAQLEKEGATVWSGVKNALARKHLRQVKAGDRVLYYSTGSDRAIVGEMRAASDSTPDPKSDDANAVVVKVVPVCHWEPGVTLQQIKEDPTFADWELVRISRLSVMPVSAECWQRLVELREENRLHGSSP